MKKIIALYRRANTGKTRTLNYLIAQLDNKNEGSVAEDRRVSIPYGNKKIAITTWGDNGHEIRENIKYFEKEDCDILVTATRSRGATTGILYDYAKKIGAEIIWIEKNLSASLEELINQTQAKDIQALIDSL